MASRSISKNTPGRSATKPKRKATAASKSKASAGDTARQRELTGKANPAAAFRAIRDLENDLTSMDQMASALHIIACSVEDYDKAHADALCGLAYAMDEHLKRAWEQRSIAWDATWAYAHGCAP